MKEDTCTTTIKPNNRLDNVLLKLRTDLLPKINALQTLSSEIIKHFRENCEQFKDLQIVQFDLMKSLKNVHGEQIQRNKEELVWQQNLDAVSCDTERNVSEDLADLYCLLGYAISDFKILSNDITQITLQYQEDCWLELRHQAGEYELLQMHPKHLRFEELQLMLRQTQDVQGLLTYVRKFYEYTKSLKTTTI